MTNLQSAMEIIELHDGSVDEVRKPKPPEHVKTPSSMAVPVEKIQPTSPYVAALCIGINEYQHANILKNCVSDASSVRAKLQDLGIADHVRELTTPDCTTFSSLKLEVHAFIKHCRGDHTVPRAILLFFAGHGVQIRGVNYFVPCDAACSKEQDVKKHCLDIGWVLCELEKIPGIPKIVIFDACRDAPFDSSWKLTAHSMEQMVMPVNTKLVFSATAGQTASDGKQGASHSPFTVSLLEHLFQGGVSASQAIDNACVQTSLGGSQRPTACGALEEIFLVSPPELIQSVSAPTFDPDGGVFVGQVTVKVKTITRGATIGLTSLELNPMQPADSSDGELIAPAHVEGLEDAFPPQYFVDLLRTLEQSSESEFPIFNTNHPPVCMLVPPVLPPCWFILCRGSWTLPSGAPSCRLFTVLRQCLCVRYPFLVRPTLWKSEQEIFILDFPIRGRSKLHVVSLDSDGLPILRVSRDFATSQQCVLVQGSNRNECNGIYRANTTTLQGSTVFQQEGDSPMFMFACPGEVAWYVGPTPLDPTIAVLRSQQQPSVSTDKTYFDPLHTWWELTDQDQWVCQAEIRVRPCKEPSSLDASATNHEDGTVVECILSQTGEAGISAVASKDAHARSKTTTSKCFTIVTMAAVPSNFVLDVLGLILDSGFASQDEIYAAIERQQIVSLPSNMMFDVEHALEAMTNADACRHLECHDLVGACEGCADFGKKEEQEAGRRRRRKEEEEEKEEQSRKEEEEKRHWGPLLQVYVADGESESAQTGSDEVAFISVIMSVDQPGPPRRVYRVTAEGKEYLAAHRTISGPYATPGLAHQPERVRAEKMHAAKLYHFFWFELVGHAVWATVHSDGALSNPSRCFRASVWLALRAAWALTYSLYNIIAPVVYATEVNTDADWEYEAHWLCYDWLRGNPARTVPQLGCRLSKKRQLLAVWYVFVLYACWVAIGIVSMSPLQTLAPEDQCFAVAVIPPARVMLCIICTLVFYPIPVESSSLQRVRRRLGVAPFVPFASNVCRIRTNNRNEGL